MMYIFVKLFMNNKILDILLYIGIVLQMVLSRIQQSTKEQFYKCFTLKFNDLMYQ